MTRAGRAAGTVPLLPRGAVTRTFDTPEFAGMTFHEVTCRSALNKVPDASRMPFRWTINPYRGCIIACVYCFARKTHEYLDLDTGRGLRLADRGEDQRRRAAPPRAAPRRRWHGEHIAMGTNVDCYQRAEGRYRLMRGIIAALRDAANPFSILTKGALILRDLDLLVAGRRGHRRVGGAVGRLRRPRAVAHGRAGHARRRHRRLEVVRRAHRRRHPDCGVLMAPVLPFLTDSAEQLDATVAAIAASGAAHVSPDRAAPAARRPRVVAGLARAGSDPDLVPRYAELYGTRAYAPKAYQERISETVRRLAEVHGVGRERPGIWRTGSKHAARTPVAPPPAQAPSQLALL